MRPSHPRVVGLSGMLIAGGSAHCRVFGCNVTPPTPNKTSECLYGANTTVSAVLAFRKPPRHPSPAYEAYASCPSAVNLIPALLCCSTPSASSTTTILLHAVPPLPFPRWGTLKSPRTSIFESRTARDSMSTMSTIQDHDPEPWGDPFASASWDSPSHSPVHEAVDCSSQYATRGYVPFRGHARGHGGCSRGRGLPPLSGKVRLSMVTDQRSAPPPFWRASRPSNSCDH